MIDMNLLLQTVLLFFIYACLGWGSEVAYSAIRLGRFINRGFLNGPICPIYGFGVIGVVLLLEPVRDNLLALFWGSFLLTSAIEYVTGWVLEKLFHAKWWDYSGIPLNLSGYVCLPFSLIWGAACLIVVRWLHPLMARMVSLMPRPLVTALDVVFLLTFAVDLVATISAVRKLSERLTRLTSAASELHAISDELGQTIYSTTINAKEHVVEGALNMQSRSAEAMSQLEERQNQLKAWVSSQKATASAYTDALRTKAEGALNRFSLVLSEKGFGHRRLLNAFPTLRSHRNQESLEALRAFYDRHRPHRNDPAK